ncbi:hypothetical protein GGQ74_002654 [Desulfobaculum xiamenense]|uniref:Uncharacterized protein n=1 Tax=Desulfobaculum xiamenense TaxID=995050 RepID=A0A846QPP5_9BACT|nr:hypothetical protein [Desulfobaculum xiamenense]NJB68960.1 hypothetical protein [Desulfobaculum xiamenense]
MTVTAAALEAKIREMYPELDSHSLDVNVMADAATGDWLVTIDKGGTTLSTRITDADARECLEGVKCVHLGVQIGTFIKNYCLGGGACIT